MDPTYQIFSSRQQMADMEGGKLANLMRPPVASAPSKGKCWNLGNRFDFYRFLLSSCLLSSESAGNEGVGPRYADSAASTNQKGRMLLRNPPQFDSKRRTGCRT
jgi:hypothetical protein